MTDGLVCRLFEAVAMLQLTQLLAMSMALFSLGATMGLLIGWKLWRKP